MCSELVAPEPYHPSPQGHAAVLHPTSLLPCVESQTGTFGNAGGQVWWTELSDLALVLTVAMWPWLPLLFIKVVLRAQC